jgi:hypothetical protein
MRCGGFTAKIKIMAAKKNMWLPGYEWSNCGCLWSNNLPTTHVAAVLGVGCNEPAMLFQNLG